MEKTSFAECCSKLNLQFNSLSQAQEIALVAVLIMEEIGIEKTEALAVSEMLIQFVGSNNSALRQKINRIVFNKETPKGKKASAASAAESLLADF